MNNDISNDCRYEKYLVPTIISKLFFYRPLATDSLEEVLFFLSQIRQVLHRFDYLRQHDVFFKAKLGLSTYVSLLKHEGVYVRTLAFDMITLFRD